MSDSVCLCIWVYSLSIIWCKLDLISQIKTLSLPLRWYSFHVQMNSISVYSIMRCIVHCFGNNGVNWLCHLCYQIRCRPLKKHQERMETNPILGVFIIHAVVVCTNTGNPRSCKDKTSWKARTAKYNKVEHIQTYCHEQSRLGHLIQLYRVKNNSIRISQYINNR